MNLERVKGIVPPAITPLDAKGNLDEKGLEALLERFIKAGVHGIFMMGSSGEAYVLPDAVRTAAVDGAAACLKGRIPLYVGIGDNSLERTLRNGEHAAKAGADVLVLISPPYLDYSEAERVNYFQTVTDRLDLPVLLYNIPQVNGNPVSPAMLRTLAAHPRIIGIKDSESNAPKTAAMREVWEEFPEFRWFEGNDSLSGQSLLMGAHGVVNGGTNLFPSLYVDLYKAAMAGDLPALRASHIRIMHALKVFKIDAPNSSGYGAFVKTTKYGLQLQGVCSEYLSEPFQPLAEESRRKIERHLADFAE